MQFLPEEHLNALWQQYQADLQRFVRQRVSSDEDARDIVQEAITRLAAECDREPVQNPRALWYRIAGNLAIDHLRRQQRRPEQVELTEASEPTDAALPSPERALDAQKKLLLLRQIVTELPPKCREVFELRKFRHYDQQQIADKLGISRRMVEKHLQKALQHCRQRLQELDAWPP